MSTFAAGSGNGTPGGNFNFEFYVLAGDVNGDGKVSAADFNVLRSNSSPVVNATNWHYDINGDGKISAGDQNSSRSRSGTILANYPEPLAPPTGDVVFAVLGGAVADASAPAVSVPAADAAATLGGDAVTAPATAAGDSPAIAATPDTSPASVPAVAAPVASAADETPSAPTPTLATAATVAAAPAADVPPSALPWLDASPVIVSSVPVLPAEETLPVVAARDIPAASVVSAIQSDGWEAEQAVLREAALVEAADTALLADGSQAAARDAWFAELGGRRDGLVSEVVGLDAVPSPAARSPVMAAEETAADAGAAFYRQLAAKHTLRLVSDPTEDDTDLAMLATTNVRPSISASPIRGIGPVGLSGAHAAPAGENHDVWENG